MPAGPFDPSVERPSPSASLPAGYEFVRMLGSGSAGAVVLARQLRLDRLVAIKSVLAGAHDRYGQMRLEREGRALVALRHPGIVTVYELRPTPAGAALVMEYVEGGQLHQLMDGDPPDAVHVVDLLAQIAAALIYAHEHGVVHRDVKPANVLLTIDGRAKVADFGLARLSSVPAAFRTSAPGLAGTPAYLAPEQILDPRRELPATDTYAFAVLAYEVLTGVRPYPARGVADVIAAHLHAAPVPPWLIVPGLPVEVGRVLLAGLAKDPRNRPSLARIAEQIAEVPSEVWVRLFASRPRRTDGPPSLPPVEATVQPQGAAVPVAMRSGFDPPTRWSALPPPSSPVRPASRVRHLAFIGLAVLAGAVLGILVVLIASRA